MVMKTILAPLMLCAAVLSVAQQDPPVVKTENGKVTITSRGKDVREVLYDLFYQSKKNFALLELSKTELYLNLSEIEFADALDVVARQANLKIEIVKEVYFISKKPLVDPKTTPSGQPTGAEPVAGTGTTPKVSGIDPGTLGGQPPKAEPKTITDADLRKRLTTRHNMIDIRELFADFSRQTGVPIEVTAEVPAYKVKAFLIDTSLRFAMDTITKKAKLKYVRTDAGTLRVTS